MTTKIKETETEFIIEECDGSRLVLDTCGDSHMLINTSTNVMQSVSLSPTDARELIRVMEDWLGKCDG